MGSPEVIYMRRSTLAARCLAWCSLGVAGGFALASFLHAAGVLS